MPVDNPLIKKAWESSERFYNDIITRQETGGFKKIRGTSHLSSGIFIHDGQPGTGKTYSLAQAIKKDPMKRIAFFTANHDHIEKFKKDLAESKISEVEYIHGKGFARDCKQYPPKNKNRKKWTKDERLVHKIYNGFGVKSSRLLCSNCKDKDNCNYYKYTHTAENYRITLQPLEFLFTKYNKDKDIFVIDEAVEKKEILSWNFKYNQLKQFCNLIEDISEEKYGLRKHIGTLLRLHQTIIKNTSLIFTTKSPETLFGFNDNTFKHKTGFLQEGSYVVHSKTISLGELLHNDEKLRNNVLIFFSQIADGIIEYTNEQIRKVVKKRDYVKIDALIDNYIPIWECVRFFQVLLIKMYPEDSCFLVSEKLESTQFQDISHRQSIKREGKYEWGFSNDNPYIRNIKNNKCIISKIGKVYDEDKIRDLNLAKDTWFTVGHPFLFQVFNHAEEKPVILLDATYNNLIFEKLRVQWRGFRDIEKKNHRVSNNISKINRPTITNKNSIVYDVKGHFPLATMETKLPKIIGSIATTLDEKPKTHAIISSLRYEKDIQRLFPKSVTAHHFNERGKNIDAEMLFAIGTPFIRPYSVVFDYILTFNEYPKSVKIIRDNGKFVGYRDTMLNEILRIKVHDENYHEMHRNRPLLYDRINYAFCELPERLRVKDEITVKPVELDKISGYPLFRVMEKIIENEGMDSTWFYHKTRNQDLYNRVGGAKALSEQHQKADRITIRKDKAKTSPRFLIYYTDEGKKWYEKQRNYYIPSFLYKKRQW